MKNKKYLDFLLNQPYKLGHLLGFTKLTELHNDWIIRMVRGVHDETLQAHRGSYKTTCVSISLALIIVLLPNKKTLFMRKTDDDVKEIVRQVKNILMSQHMRYFVKVIYGIDLKLTTTNMTEISTNLVNTNQGTSQLVSIGCGGSLTGKHFDYIFTDDIVNLKDRVSKAERERTKTVYQELQNVKNRGGRIFNTGTPWHKEDCFTIMPNADVYDCYSTNLISCDELDEIRSKMSPSLFSANYEMKHIASEDVLFKEPPAFFDDISLLYNSIVHIDAGYSGSDSCALTIMKKAGDKYYAFGETYSGHIDDIIDSWLSLIEHYKGGFINTESNADKGYLAKAIKLKGGNANRPYHESMNKYVKIATYLKPIWKDVIWYRGTSKEYLDNILEYNEFAEHDDCVDSCACCARLLFKPNRKSLI